MKKISKLFSLVLVSGVVLSSCTKVLDEYLVNPRNPEIETADVDLYLNAAQLNFNSFYLSASNFGGALTRQQVFFGPTYNNGYVPESFDDIWSTAYTGVYKNVDALLPIAESQKKFFQAGIAKILKAYTTLTLVDQFGDVPFSEANLGAANTNPVADPSAGIYDACLALLDEAIANINSPENAGTPTNDLFFKGSKTAWVRLANTLKLRAYVTTRLVDASAKDKINAILTSDLIDDVAGTEDFVFKYGTKQDAPDSRHPWYANNYTTTTPNDYLSTYFMWALIYGKGSSLFDLDPRRRFYFYRQVLDYSKVDEETCACAFQARPAHFPEDMPYCLPDFDFTFGYWGRDHGDNSGIPPDDSYRTTYGVYPAAGEFDDSKGGTKLIGSAGKGAGIDPIWMSFYTKFLLAESALTLGTTGDARALLEQGIRASISKVVAFPATVGVTVPSTRVPTPEKIDAYVNNVLASYDAADADGKLDIIMKEYYLAAFGNGIEPYNNYRRTGKPANLQLCVTTPNPGLFMRSALYPSVYVNRNINAPAQKQPGAAVKVFWDNNPDDFVK